MKIAVLGFLHESNSFVSIKTEYSDFHITRSTEIIRRWSETHHEIGGFIQAAKEKGQEFIPLLTATATPSGVVTKNAYDLILSEMKSLLRSSRVDGLLLALHGAMVSEGLNDADGNTVKELRDILGDSRPIVLTLDCHANVSKKMVENVDATILYRSNPHIDQFQRGKEAFQLLHRALKKEIHPTQWIEQPPMIINISKQYTSQRPLALLLEEVEKVCNEKRVLSVSLGLGFAFSDVPKLGTSIVVVTDNDVGLAKKYARRIGLKAWEMRDQFLNDLPSPREAVREAGCIDGTVVLMDVGDNVGGGSPGDSTVLFNEIMDQGLERGLVILTDPQAVNECLGYQAGESVRLDVGGKTDDIHGDPIKVNGILKGIYGGKFSEEAPRHGGQREYDQGTTVVIETNEGHKIIINSIRTPPFSLQQITSLGIDPEEMDVIVVKGVIAPRAAYESIACRIITVNTPGSTSADLDSFVYKNRRYPIYPFELETMYNPAQ